MNRPIWKNDNHCYSYMGVNLQLIFLKPRALQSPSSRPELDLSPASERSADWRVESSNVDRIWGLAFATARGSMRARMLYKVNR